MEANGTRLDEQRFPGRQGRIVFAYLAVQNGRAVPRDELAEALWGDELPATWEKALRVLMTKLRALLEECGIDGSTALTSAFGCYQLTLPADAWIDVNAATGAVERAEAAFATGDLDEARAEGTAAAGLARPSFLPGEDGSWVEDQRRDLRKILVRALECLRNTSFAAGEFGEAVRNAAEITELEPFRESSYRALMQAHVAAGDPAEALRVYERCRRFLADELGAYPAAESEAVYLEILRSSGSPAAEVDRAGKADLGAASVPPNDVRSPRGRRRVAALVTVVLLVAVAAVAAGLAYASRDRHPLVIRPHSLVRLDPESYKPTQDVPIGPKADLVVAAGGYVWVTHGLLRYQNDEGLHDAGYRGLMRFDPSTGAPPTPVMGGLAPCGITADPSGDLWVANCYATGQGFEVVRVDAKTLGFEKHMPVPSHPGYYRGMTFGNRSLWVAGVSGGNAEDRRLTRLDPRTRNGTPHTIQLDRAATVLAWSADYGNLWMTNFGNRSVSRMDPGTKAVVPFESRSESPSSLAVTGNAVWVADWDHARVIRLPADGSGPPQRITLRHPCCGPGGVTSIAAGAGGIWVAVPDDHAVYRIDPLHPTDPPTRIPLTYAPWGVTVGEDGRSIWVTLRGRTTYVSNG